MFSYPKWLKTYKEVHRLAKEIHQHSLNNPGFGSLDEKHKAIAVLLHHISDHMDKNGLGMPLVKHHIADVGKKDKK